MPDYEERRAANDRSLNDAEAHRQVWTADEDDLLRETMGEPIEDVAYVLGRSIFAVDMRRSLVRNNIAVTRTRWASAKQAAGRGEPTSYGTRCDRCGLIHRGEC